MRIAPKKAPLLRNKEAEMDDNIQEKKGPSLASAAPDGPRREQYHRSESRVMERQRQAWRDSRIKSSHTMIVLMVLSTLFGDDDTFSATHAKLALLARMTPRSLHTHINKIEEFGYITRTSGIGRAPTVYRSAGGWIM